MPTPIAWRPHQWSMPYTALGMLVVVVPSFARPSDAGDDDADAIATLSFTSSTSSPLRHLADDATMPSRSSCDCLWATGLGCRIHRLREHRSRCWAQCCVRSNGTQPAGRGGWRGRLGSRKNFTRLPGSSKLLRRVGRRHALPNVSLTSTSVPCWPGGPKLCAADG